MQLDLQHCNVVVLGAWNQALFTPDWVARLLSPSERDQEIVMQIGMGDAGIVAQYVAANFQLVVAPGQLTVQPRSPELAERPDLAPMEEVALKVVRTLCHTPVRAFGVNLRAIVQQPSDTLLGLMDTPDRNELAKEGFALRQSSVGRRLHVEGDPTVRNLKLTLGPQGSVVAEINHHRDVANADDVLAQLPGAVSRDCQLTARVLRAAYELDGGEQ